MLLFSCQENYTPKPKGYFRIELPEKTYQKLDNNCPYTFEYPVYGKIEDFEAISGEPCWLNIVFPDFKGKIHITYKKVNKNLPDYIEDVRTFAYKHLIKADDIVEHVVQYPEKKSFGMIYDIKGNTASAVNFFITDSTSHFLSGALYFSTKPNADSLRPVIDFCRKDIEYLMETIEWK